MEVKSAFDYKYRAWNRNSFSDTNDGFSGKYVNKKLGQADVYVTKLGNEKVYTLMLDVIHNGFEYHRNLELPSKPTYRYAGLKAREFLEHLKREKIINETK